MQTLAFRSLPIVPGALAVVLLSASGLQAQSHAAATVTGSGTVEIKKQPEILRVQIELMVTGKTMKEAIDKLKTRREEVQTALVQLGAKKDRIAFGDPTTADDLAGRQGDIDRMVRSRARVQGKPAEKTETPAFVSGTVRVEFPLPTGNPDEFLLAAHELQDKIKRADLGGLKGNGKLSPQEQEAIEEAAGQPRQGGNEGPARGEPMFVYVSKISEEERTKALAGAYSKAKRDAERLARAAGAELGALQRLTNPLQGLVDDDPYAYARRGYGFNAVAVPRLDGDDDTPEAVGLQAGKVSLRLGVAADFALRNK